MQYVVSTELILLGIIKYLAFTGMPEVTNKKKDSCIFRGSDDFGDIGKRQAHQRMLAMDK